MAKNTKNNTKTASIIKAVKKFSSDVIRLVEFGLVIASVYFFPAIITITIVSFVT